MMVSLRKADPETMPWRLRKADMSDLSCSGLVPSPGAVVEAATTVLRLGKNGSCPSLGFAVNTDLGIEELSVGAFVSTFVAGGAVVEAATTVLRLGKNGSCPSLGFAVNTDLGIEELSVGEFVSTFVAAAA